MKVISIKKRSTEEGHLIYLATHEELHNVFPLALLLSGIQILFNLSNANYPVSWKFV